MSLTDSENTSDARSGDTAKMSTGAVESPIKTVPAIAEALCELHFTVYPFSQKEAESVHSIWEPKWFGKLLQELGADYDLEPAQIKMMRISSQGGQKPEVSEVKGNSDRMIYRHKDSVHLLQLSPGLLTINEVGNYPGWQTFSEHIKNAWETFSRVCPHIQVTRIGLRYINRVQRGSETARVGDWLHNSDWLPPRMAKQEKDFFFRFNTRFNSDCHMKLTVVEEQTDDSSAPIIFDLDAISQSLKVSSWNEVFSKVDHLHQLIRKEFKESITDRYKSFVSNLEG